MAKSTAPQHKRAGRHIYQPPSTADKIANLNASLRRINRSNSGRTLDLGRRRASKFPSLIDTDQNFAATPVAIRTNSASVLVVSNEVTNAQKSAPKAQSAANAPTSIKIGQRADLFEGSLTRASAWTLLGTLLPGLGFIPTKLRALGAIILFLGLITLTSLTVWALFGNPISSFLQLTAKPWFLNSLMIAIASIAVFWILIIFGTNRLHNKRERLHKEARVASAAFAYALCLLIALPATHAINSIWAVQSLISSDNVFGAEEKNNEFASGQDPWAHRERVNILLLGQDAGADREGTRPDTIMVASIDTKSGKTALFSIPRNLQWVRFPEGSPLAELFPYGFDYYGENQNLINAVWTFAEEVRPDLFPGDPNPGRTATTMAVEETLGLKIDYYSMVNLQGFEDLVDAIGGVDIEVERDIPIGGGAGPIDGYIEKGWQHLDGYQALWYARSREGSSDYDRICRQQRIIREITREADIPTLAISLPRLIGATERNIETNIPSARLDAFTELALRVQKGGFNSYPINPEVTNPGSPDYDYLKEWVQASIKESVSDNAKVQSQSAAEGRIYLAAGPTITIYAVNDFDETDKDPLANCMPGDEDPLN